MKQTLIIALLCIGIGIATGWYLKPGQQPVESSAEPSRPTSRAVKHEEAGAGAPSGDQARPSHRSGVSIKTVSSEQELDPEMKQAMQDAEKRQIDSLKKRLNDRFDMRIVAMVKELGLNAAQEKALRAFYAEQMEKITLSGGMSALADPEKVKQTAAALRGDGLNERMQDVLSKEQMEGLVALQQRKKNSKIESRAMKDLAKLQQNLDLTDEQKDGVYNVLIEDAEKSLEAQSDADYVTREMMASMGVEMDLGDVDMGMVTEMSRESMATPQNRTEFIARLKEQRQQRIDAKVERLAPVLTEAQQQQYRRSLENKGGMFNMMLQGLESE